MSKTPERKLWDACRDGKLAEVVETLEKHPNTDINKEVSGDTSVYVACENGHVEVVRELLKHPKIDVSRGNPLYVACGGGYVEIAKELLKNPKIDVNKESQFGAKATPLYVACQNVRVEVVKELLKHPKIDVNKGTSSDRSPLCVTCEKGHIEIVRRLLKHPKIEVNKCGSTPLYTACCRGHVEVVRELLKHPKIDVGKGYVGSNENPLFAACHRGYVEIARELLKHPNIEVNNGDKYRMTPLHRACLSGYTKVVEVLLSHPNININKKNLDVQTALDITTKDEIRKLFAIGPQKLREIQERKRKEDEMQYHLLGLERKRKEEEEKRRKHPEIERKKRKTVLSKSNVRETLEFLNETDILMKTCREVLSEFDKIRVILLKVGKAGQKYHNQNSVENMLKKILYEISEVVDPKNVGKIEKFLTETNPVVNFCQQIFAEFEKVRGIVESCEDITTTQFEAMYQMHEQFMKHFEKLEVTNKIHEDTNFKKVFDQVRSLINFLKDVEEFFFNKYLKFRKRLGGFKENEEQREKLKNSKERSGFESFVNLTTLQFETARYYFTSKDEIETLSEVFEFGFPEVLSMNKMESLEKEFTITKKFNGMLMTFEKQFGDVVQKVKSNGKVDVQNISSLKEVLKVVQTDQEVPVFVKMTIENAKKYLDFTVLEKYLGFHQQNFETLVTMEKERKECMEKIREEYFRFDNYRKAPDENLLGILNIQRENTKKLNELLSKRMKDSPKTPISNHEEIQKVFCDVEKKIDQLGTILMNCASYFDLLMNKTYFGVVRVDSMKPNGIGKKIDEQGNLLFIGLFENGVEGTGIFISKDGKIEYYQHDNTKIPAKFANQTLCDSVLSTLGINKEAKPKKKNTIGSKLDTRDLSPRSSWEEIGRGGVAVVYKAAFQSTPVAVKVISGERKTKKSELSEIEKLLLLDNPFVIRTYGCCLSENNKEVYLVLELMEKNAIEYCEEASLLEKLELMIKMCYAVFYLHSQTPKKNKIIHRDIKGSNFLVSNDGKEVKISDFGLAKVKQHSKTFSMTNLALGTYLYFAPELLMEERVAEYSIWSDIYALGITFHELLFNIRPFSTQELGNDAVAMKKKLKSEEYYPIYLKEDKDDYIPHIPRDIYDDLLVKMWAKSPKTRIPLEKVIQYLKERTTQKGL